MIATPTDTDEPPAADWQARVATVYLGAVGVLAFIGHPLALIPEGVNPDARGTRLAAIAACVLLGLATLAVRRWSWRTRLILGALAWAAAAAVVALPSALNAHKVTFTLPTTLLAMVLGLPLLLALGWRLQRGLLVAVLGLAVLAVAHGIAAPAWVTEAAELAAYALVPLAVGVAARYGLQRPCGVAWLATGLWLVVMLLALVEWLTRLHRPALIFGSLTITGNPNWTAATVLGLCPWVAWLVYRACRRWGARVAGGAAALSLVPTVVVVDYCQARAGFVAIAAVVCWAVLCRLLPWRVRVGLAIVCALLALAVIWRPPAALQAAGRDDVRLPIWQTTLQLALARPLTGVGPGRLPRYSPERVAAAGLYQRPVDSSIVEHPHNEVLNVAAQLGLPGLLAWAGLLSVLLGNPLARERPVVERLALLSAQLLVIMALFDKPWVQAPTALLGLAALGLVLRGWLRRRPPWGALQHAAARLPLLSLVGLLVLAGGYLCVRETAASWLHWRAVGYHDYRRTDPRNLATAIDLLERSLAWKPHNAELEMKLGYWQLYDLYDVDAARLTFESVYAENPVFGHVNRRLGQIARVQGDLRSAIDYYAADARLYPDRPQSWQRLQEVQAEAGDLAGIVASEDRLRESIWRKRQSHPGEAAARSQMQAWPDSIAAGNLAATIAMNFASRTSDYIDSDYPDEVPESMRGLAYNPDDLRYFQALLQRDEFLRALALTGGPVEQAEAVLAAAHARPAEHVLARDAWLLAGLDLDCLIVAERQGVVLIEGALYTWDAADSGLRAVAAMDLREGEFVVDRGAFAVRNQAVCVYAEHCLPERPYLQGGRSPLARYARLALDLRALGLEPTPEPTYRILPHE